LQADLVVKNGKVVTSTDIFEANIAIDDGVIVAVSKLPITAERYIDARGALVLPGFVDPHVHLGLRAPFEADCKSETPAAAYGGVTTVLTYFRPKGRLSDELDARMKTAQDTSTIDIAFQPAIGTAEQVSEIVDVMKMGVSSFKFLLNRPYLEEKYGTKQPDDGVLYKALVELRKRGGLPKVHCENYEIARQLIPALKATGRNDLAVYDEARPEFCEEEHMQRVALLARVVGTPIYVVHVSIGKGLAIAHAAEGQGVTMYLETCPHYLTLDKDNNSVGIRAKVNPPVRSKENIETLWNGVRHGEIDCIGTDHASGKLEGKEKDIWSADAAFPGLQTYPPIMITEGIRRGITIQRIVEVCCTNNARINLIPRKGAISIGYDGDLTIVDLRRRLRVSRDMLVGSSDYSVYEGMDLIFPHTTILRGQVLVEDGSIVAKPGVGKILKGTTLQ
jgi:dihydroorotase (multifunctional complex type)